MGKSKQLGMDYLAPTTLGRSVTSTSTYTGSSLSISSELRSNGANSHSSPIKMITNDYRYIVAEWMYQVSERIYKDRDSSRKVFHLAVRIMDEILYLAPTSCSSHSIMRDLLNADFLQLTGLCCVVISISHLCSKQSLISPNCPNFAQKVLAFCGSKYSESQYSHLFSEVERLFTLSSFSETCLDSFYSFLTNNPSLFLSNEPLKNLSLVLLDSFILDFSTLKYPPSVVAECSYLVAKKLIDKDKSPLSENFVNKSCFEEIFYVAYFLFKDETKKTPNGNIICNVVGNI